MNWGINLYFAFSIQKNHAISSYTKGEVYNINWIIFNKLIIRLCKIINNIFDMGQCELPSKHRMSPCNIPIKQFLKLTKNIY